MSLLFFPTCAFLIFMTLTLDQAQRNLAEAARHALQGESVVITLGAETLRLCAEVPLRPPDYFTECYLDPEDAAFEEHLCHDSSIVLDP
jgi:hypothetical protein